MARKPRKAKAEPQQEAAPTPAMEMISANKFKSLLRKCTNTDKESSELRSSLGGTINAAVEHDHLSKRAFSMFRRLHKMSDAQLAETLAHLDYYRDIGGLDERAKKQGQMFARTEAGEEDEDAETASSGRSDNVSQFPATA